MHLTISQNFLNSTDLIKQLIQKSGIGDVDTVLDIGAGKGIITRELSERCKKVIAFEFDATLAGQLRQNFANSKNVEIIQGNFLEFKLNSLDNYRVFSNIPFSITSDIMSKLYFHGNYPEAAYIIMQKEAAQRYMGKRDNVLISLLLKPFFQMSIVHDFNKSDFTPKPSVDTVLLKIIKLKTPLINITDIEDFRHFVIFTLLQQKPTLKLRTKAIFSDTQFLRLSKDFGFPLTVQASGLHLNTWVALYNYYKSGVSSEKKYTVNDIGRTYMTKLRKFSGVSSRTNHKT